MGSPRKPSNRRQVPPSIGAFAPVVAVYQASTKEADKTKVRVYFTQPVEVINPTMMAAYDFDSTSCVKVGPAKWEFTFPGDVDFNQVITARTVDGIGPLVSGVAADSTLIISED